MRADQLYGNEYFYPIVRVLIANWLAEVGPQYPIIGMLFLFAFSSICLFLCWLVGC
jgi:hypothetical protein